MRATGVGLAAIAAAVLVSGCAASSEELRRENDELRSMILSTRSDLDEVRRDQDQLRATVEYLQHARGGAPPPTAAAPAKATQQRWPADPWGSATEPFSASGAPRDLDTLEPGQGVSPSGRPTQPNDATSVPSAQSAMPAAQQPTPVQPIGSVPIAAPPYGNPPAAPSAAPPMAAMIPPAGVAPTQSASGPSGSLAPAAPVPQTQQPPTAAPPVGAVPAPRQPTPSQPAPVTSGGQSTAGQEIVASVRGAGTGADPAAASPSSVPANLTGSLYDEGVKAFNDGRYDDAIQNFRDFIHQQPQSAYADDAQFWIGESNVRKGEYNTAVKEFNQVVLRYGSGDRSAASLLKLAEVFSKMGDRVDARLSLQKLVNRYPGSSEAGQAYKMLQEMGG